MLDDLQKDYASRNFGVYEHDWTFASGYLGEPFLINDCLAYYDGRSVNIAAFSLEHPSALISFSTVKDIAATVTKNGRFEILHVWGVLDLPASLEIGALKPGIGSENELSEWYDGEYCIFVPAHQYSDYPEARKAIRSASNKGLTYQVKSRDLLTADHFRLVEEWVRTRPIGLPSVAAMASLPAYIKFDHVRLVEVTREGVMVGFAVVSMPSIDHAVLVASFSERYSGARIEDQLMFGVIEECRERKISTIHLGYAGSASLARFKEKWGARMTGPRFREVVLSVDKCADSCRDYSFFWPSRLQSASAAGRSRESSEVAPRS